MPDRTAIRRSGRVVVADDNQPIRETIVDILEGAGYRVSGAVDSEDALSQLESGDVALLLVDLGLPGRKKGLMLLDRLTDPPPVILMSGLLEAPPSDSRVSLCLSKPIPPTRLLEEVERYVEK